MIEVKIGNLLECEERLIVHGCNDECKMGAGVALAIKNIFPEAVEEYFNYEYLLIGDVIFGQTNDGRYLANAITQDLNDDDLRFKYWAMKYWCDKINVFCEENNIDKIAMPMIGAGLGGADFSIITYYLGKYLNVDVVVYKLED